MRLRLLSIALLAAISLGERSSAGDATRACPVDMVHVAPSTCIDPFEACLEDLDESGRVIGVHPHHQLVAGKRVRAAVKQGAMPQAYITQREAAAACAEAGKRLCSDAEWLDACRGRPKTRHPHGERRRAGYCNDDGVEPLPRVFPGRNADWFRVDLMNDPRLDQVPGTVARSGSFTRCRSEAGVFDMVGNVHEWTSAPEGTMRGGFYLDTQELGEGCDYEALGHDGDYHDYSTGFRCCKDASASR